MIQVMVRYFAAAKERAGVDAEPLELADGQTVLELRKILHNRHPNLAPLLKICRFGCNDAFVQDDHVLMQNDEVLVLPPASGGAPRVQLLETPILAGQAEQLVELDGTGGICAFTGTVRATNRGKVVTRLEYSAHPPLALREMQTIVDEAMTRWQLRDVVILHRVGVLDIGEIAVQIAVASAHRAECFEACRWTIDELKARVPIWKKEVTADGEEWLGSTP